MAEGYHAPAMPLLGVTLTANGALRLDARPPQLTLGDVEGARELEPGRPLRLMSSRGETLATGVADPENGLVRIWGPPDGDPERGARHDGSSCRRSAARARGAGPWGSRTARPRTGW